MVRAIILLFFLLHHMFLISQNTSPFAYWKTLDKIPDEVGFAGSFAGVSNNVLIVAGGANFPENGAPWRGSKKVWYDHIFVLKKSSGRWELTGNLAKPLGYGTSVSTKDGLVIIGGSNESGHFSEVYILKYENGGIKIENLPSLPVKLANSCGAVADNKIYVLGGLVNADDKETKNIFLCLDLKDLKKGWVELPQLPGPSRMLAVASAVNNTFFVFSGTQLQNGERKYLQDCYSYSPKYGWKRLEDMPKATVAAPSPTYNNKKAIYVFGGDDGSLAKSDLREKHPGFSTSILQFSLKNKKWSEIGKIPVDTKSNAVEEPNQSKWAPVTTTIVVWNNIIVFPGGEVRPATRTPNVLAVELKYIK